MALIDSLNKTQLDLTNTKQYNPGGVNNDNLSKKDYILEKSQLDLTGNGPKNAPQYKHVQTYTPNKQYDPNGINNDNLSRKDYMLESSQLDLTGNGPKNYPQYKHVQKYIPFDGVKPLTSITYLNSLPPLDQQ